MVEAMWRSTLQGEDLSFPHSSSALPSSQCEEIASLPLYSEWLLLALLTCPSHLLRPSHASSHLLLLAKGRGGWGTMR